MTDKPRKFEDIMSRIKEASAMPSADTEAVKGIKDPADRGTKDTPDHPEGDSKSKSRIPDAPANKDMTDAHNRIPGEDHGVSGTGEDVPATESGDKKDEAATEPTTPIDKIAGIMERVNKIRNPQKEASDKTEDKEASDKTETAPKKEAGEKEDEVDIELTPEFHFKIAQAILSTEEGVNMVEGILRKEAGEEAARELISQAQAQEEEFEKSASEQAQWSEYLAQVALANQAQFEELTKNASDEDLADMQRIAQIHEKIASELEHDFEKAAYQQGAMDAAAMEDAVAGGGEIPEEAPMPGPEEILMMLDQLVQSGELDEETAMAIAEQIMAEAQGGGGEEVPEEVAKAASAVKDLEKELLND